MSGTELERQPDIVTARMRLRAGAAPARRGADRALFQRPPGGLGDVAGAAPHPPGAAEALIERATAPGAAEL